MPLQCSLHKWSFLQTASLTPAQQFWPSAGTQALHGLQLSHGRSKQHSTAGRASTPGRRGRSGSGGQRPRGSQGRPVAGQARPGSTAAAVAAGRSGSSAAVQQRQPEAGGSGRAGPAAGTARPAQPAGGRLERLPSAGSEIVPAEGWPPQQGRAGRRPQGLGSDADRQPSRQKSGPLPPGLARAGSSGQPLARTASLARAGSGAGLTRAGSGPGLPRAHSGAHIARAGSGAGAGPSTSSALLARAGSGAGAGPSTSAAASSLQTSPSTQLMNMLNNIERELGSPQQPRAASPTPLMPPRPVLRSPEAPPPSFSRRRWAGPSSQGLNFEGCICLETGGQLLGSSSVQSAAAVR